MKSLDRLKAGKRKTVVLDVKKMVSFSFLEEGMALPLVVRPEVEGLSLPDWIRENRQALNAKLNEHGALLFRGFDVAEVETFQAAVVALCGPLASYMERSSPRHSVADKIYTSTDYPPSESIFLHNEQSYNLKWCAKIGFFCPQPAKSGGQTPIADTRKILRHLDPEIRERFRRKGYIYRRNYGEGLGLTWTEAFQTEDREEVARYCRANRIHFKWRDRDRLTTWQKRPAIRRHPGSGVEVWFNHCTFFHVDTLSESVKTRLKSEFADEDLPSQTLHGDGSAISRETIGHLQVAYLAEKVVFDWEKNDLLVLDNMLVAHGREPFTGPRRVLVAMADIVSQPDEDDKLPRFEAP